MSDKRFIVLVSTSALFSTVALILVFFQVLQVNTRLEAQVIENRQATDKAVEDIKAENKRVYKQHTDFLLKCITLLQRDQLAEATASGCTEAADSSIQSNSTRDSTPSAVINPTISKEAATPPPKAPEQPQPSRPVPMAPPPEDVQPALNLLDIINLPENIKPVLELRQ